MNKMKQLLLLATAALIAFSLSACSFEDGKVNDNADKTKATDQHTADQKNTPPAGATAQNDGNNNNGGMADNTNGAMETNDHTSNATAGQGGEEDGGRLPGIVDDAKDDIEDGIDDVGDDIKDGIEDAKDDITGAGNNNNGAGVGSTDGASNGR